MNPRLLVCLAILLAICWQPALDAVRVRAGKPLAVRALGQGEVHAGGPAAFRILCLDPVSGAPRPGIPVTFDLGRAGRTLSRVDTVADERGEATASIPIPESAEGALDLSVTARGGTWLAPDVEVVRHSLTAVRRAQLLLTTDKPFYQPGQTMHIRALARRRPDGRPLAGEKLTVEVLDSRGNKVHREELTLSEFGVAGCAFRLADLVNEGDYKVRGTVGACDSERTVTVKRYVLPKFKLEVLTDRTFYRPGETVRVRVDARYFFGKPVGGAVEVDLSAFQAGVVAQAHADGTLGPAGGAEFALPLPAYVTGVDDGGKAIFLVKVRVTDTTGHRQEVTRTFPVARATMTVEAIPEAGHLVPGVENVVYVVASRPDGNPIEGATVQVDEVGASALTDAAGLAELKLHPMAANDVFQVRVRDRTGAVATAPLAAADGAGGPRTRLLLRTDDGIYRVGQTARLTVLSSEPTGTVYVDVVREGQTLSTRTLELAGGSAQLSLDLTEQMSGTLKLRAYRILADGAIARSGKVIVVGSTRGLSVIARPDRGTYEPGARGAVDLEVTDGAGKPVAASLGIDIVDESVFALADFVPGLERTYFAIEEELAKPKYQLKAAAPVFDLPREARRRWVENPKEAQDQLARIGRVLMAPIVELWTHALDRSTLAEKRQKLAEFTMRSLASMLRATTLVWTPVTLALLLLWLCLRGAGACGGPLLAPGTKPELQAYRLGWWAALPVLIALVPGCPLFAFGGAASFAALVLVAVALAGFLKVFAGAETRAHLPAGPGFNAGGALLFALGAQAALVFFCRSGLELTDRGNPIDLFTCEMAAAALLSIAAYTVQLEPRAGLRGEPPELFRPGALTLAILLVEAFVTFGVVSAFPYTPLTGVLLAWWVLGPAAMGGLVLLVIDHGARKTRQAVIAAIVIALCFCLLAVSEMAARWYSYHSVDANALMIFNLLLLALPLAVYAPARAIGWIEAPGPVSTPDAPPARLFRLRYAIAYFLPVWACVIGMELLFLWASSIDDGPRNAGGNLVLVALGWLVLSMPAALKLIGVWRLLPGGQPALGGGEGLFDAVRDAGASASLAGVAVLAIVALNATGSSVNGLIQKVASNLSTVGGGWGGAVPAPVPSAAPGAGADKAGVRIRSWFPETLYSNPALLTDERGKARLELTMADSITTWRMSGLACSRAGELGSFQLGLRCFQDFFVDLDLPVALTKGDEVSIPVAVYNYLDRPQEVKIEIERAPWFALDGEPVRALSLAAGEVTGVKFRIRALVAGSHTLTAYGIGSSRKDAIRRTIEVLPDGKRFDEAQNRRIGAPWATTVTIPPASLDGAERMVLRVYPSGMSQLIEGLDTMIQAPYG